MTTTLPNLDQPLPKPNARGLWDAALWYAEAGIPILPLWPGGKTPNADLVGSGWKVAEVATTDPAEVDAYWSCAPWSNIGAPQGPAATGTTVADLDYKHGKRPRTQLAERCRELGIVLPRGLRARTPSGEHEWFLLGDDVERLPKHLSWIPDAVDVIATGGYVVLPPSRLHRPTYEAANASRLVKPGDPPPLPAKVRRLQLVPAVPEFLSYAWVRPEVPDPSDAPDGVFPTLAPPQLTEDRRGGRPRASGGPP